MKRRGEKGGVHVYKPEGGKTYYIRYRVNGVQKRESTGHTDEGLAKVFAANVARMIGLQSGSLDEKMRLAEIAESLVRDCRELEGKVNGLNVHPPTTREWFVRKMKEARNNANGDDRCVKESSLRRLQNIDTKFLAHLGGLSDQPLSRLTSEDVKGFLSAWKTAGFSGKTRRHALNRIRSVLGKAVDAGLIPHNIASARKLGHMVWKDASIRMPFNQRQLSAIWAATEASPRWMRRGMLLGIYTAQRASDCCAMEWKHVRDLDGPLPTIVVTQRKTGSVVIIPVAEALRKELQAVPSAERHGHLLGEVGEFYAVHDQRRRWIKAWRELLNSLDLPSLADVPVPGYVERAGKCGRGRFSYSFHSFRHTIASMLSGMSAHHLLGHRAESEKNLGTTLLYRHCDMARLKQELDAVELSSPTNIVQLTATA